jgi:hypothetical protein
MRAKRRVPALRRADPTAGGQPAIEFHCRAHQSDGKSPPLAPDSGDVSLRGSSMKHIIESVCAVLLVSVVIEAAPLSALADQTYCPQSIVVGKTGSGNNILAYFNRSIIYSGNIPSAPGTNYECIYEGHYGGGAVPHRLGPSQFINSISTSWQKSINNQYTCNKSYSDCGFVIGNN